MEEIDRLVRGVGREIWWDDGQVWKQMDDDAYLKVYDDVRNAVRWEVYVRGNRGMGGLINQQIKKDYEGDR